MVRIWIASVLKLFGPLKLRGCEASSMGTSESPQAWAGRRGPAVLLVVPQLSTYGGGFVHTVIASAFAKAVTCRLRFHFDSNRLNRES